LEIFQLTFRIPLIAWTELLSYTALIIGRVKGKTMNTTIYAVILLLGTVASIIVMRLLFLFWNRPFKRNQDDRYLERIANALN